MKRKTKKVTLIDVARSAGVSRTAASYILGQTRGGFAKDTVERVVEIAKRMGYRPSVFARSLRTGRTKLLGLLSTISPEAINHIIPYQLEIGVSMEARKHGMDMVRVLVSHEESSDIERMRELLDKGLIECLILDNPPIGSGLIEFLQEMNSVFVVIGNPPQEGVYSVDTDNVRIGQLTTEHLIGLGHRHLAYIAPPDNIVFGNDRLEGFYSACRAASIDKYAIAVRSDNTTAGGYEAMRDILSSHKEVTGIIAADDYMAHGAMTAITEAGLSIPDDISVVGCNNDPLALSQPDLLTTVDLDFVGLGAAAADKAISIIEGKEVPCRTITGANLIVRKSSGPPRARPLLINSA